MPVFYPRNPRDPRSFLQSVLTYMPRAEIPWWIPLEPQDFTAEPSFLL